MTTQQVADRYYELIKDNKIIETQDELYSEDVISIEPPHTAQPVAKGFDAVRAKGNARRAIIEAVHNQYCSKPVVGGKYFSVALGRDITLKGKPRTQLEEIAVFLVQDGKIISEQFFY